MKNRWNYAGLGQVQYGIEDSYRLAAEWLDIPGWTVEDWGCGCAHARRYFTQAKYIGIDGSQNDYADVCGEDLRFRDSKPDGILLRHVLEHNEDWRTLLANAIRCAQKRLTIVLFIPFGPETKIINRNQDPKYLGVPDIQFQRKDIMDALGPVFSHADNVGTDTLLFCEKDSKY